MPPRLSPEEVIDRLDKAIERGEITEEEARGYYEEAKERAMEEVEDEWGR